MEKTSGIHHLGTGVRDIQAARKFYEEILEFKVSIEEIDESINTMADTFRNSPHSFMGFLKCQEAGGITVEAIKKKYPTARAIQKKPQFGDIGVNKITIAVQNVHLFYDMYQGKIAFSGTPQSVNLASGDYEFLFGRDPEGNIIEFVSGNRLRMEREGFGGLVSVGVSVTDLERSKAWYMEHFGFDVVVDEHDKFSGKMNDISNSTGMQVRTCLLDSSTREGGGMLELYEVSNPRGRSIPFGTEWGDYGYMEICLFCPGNIHDLSKYLMEQGLDVFQRPTNFGCDETGSFEYWFAYVRDPDGIFVESVGIHAK